MFVYNQNFILMGTGFPRREYSSCNHYNNGFNHDLNISSILSGLYYIQYQTISSLLIMEYVD